MLYEVITLVCPATAATGPAAAQRGFRTLADITAAPATGPGFLSTAARAPGATATPTDLDPALQPSGQGAGRVGGIVVTTGGHAVAALSTHGTAE